MSWARSLRSQLAAGAAILAFVVVALAGLTITIALDAQDRSALDNQLAQRALRVQSDASKLLLEANGAKPSSGDDYGGLLDNSGSLVRLIAGTTVLVERGEIPAGDAPVPDSAGFSTVLIDGDPWRSLVVETSPGSDVRLQVLADLGPLQARLDDSRRIVLLTTILATVLAAIGGWFVASVVTRPVRRLRDGAWAIEATGPGADRLPVPMNPLEIHDLATTLNAMLAKLETSMTTTRRFTADAGHELRTPLTSLGTYLETLHTNPDLAPERVEAMTASMLMEHRRITSLLQGLQALARGDAGAIPDFTEVDANALIAEAVRDGRRRHPSADITLHDLGNGEVTVTGWAEGLRLAIDNLLDNAVIHGRPGGHVGARLTASEGWVTFAVVDDGPGIPADLRDQVTQRFARGPDARAEGTGLGLSLVVQQASIHDGTLTLDDAPGGGLLARLTVARAQAQPGATESSTGLIGDEAERLGRPAGS